RQATSTACCDRHYGVFQSKTRLEKSRSSPGAHDARSTSVLWSSPRTRTMTNDGPSRRLRTIANPERQAAFRVGISAESRAAAFLIAKGFRILAQRWRSPLGEIDIVARRRRLLVFAEVKARASLDEAAESVNERQRRRIAAAAEIWLA